MADKVIREENNQFIFNDYTIFNNNVGFGYEGTLSGEILSGDTPLPLTVFGNLAIGLPEGTTLQRPIIDLPMIRFNSTEAEFELYNPATSGWSGFLSDYSSTTTDITTSSMRLLDEEFSEQALVFERNAYGYTIGIHRPITAVSGADVLVIQAGPNNADGFIDTRGANIELRTTTSEANSGMRWAGSNRAAYDASVHTFRDRDASPRDMLVIDSGSRIDADVNQPSLLANCFFNSHVILDDNRIFTLSTVSEASATSAVSGFVGNGSMIYNEDTDKFQGYVDGAWKEFQTSFTEDTEIVFTPSQTLTEIQDIIDALPHDMNGHILKLLFTPGTYNFYSDATPVGNSEGTLKISRFNGGQLILEPTTGYSTAITNKQDVIIKGCMLFVAITPSVHGIRFLTNDDTRSIGLTFDFCPVARVLSCSFSTFAPYTLDNAIGMRVVQSNCWANWNVFGNVHTGIQCERASQVIGTQNVDEATRGGSQITGDEQPTGYGHVATDGAILSIAGSQSTIALSGLSGISSVDENSGGLYTNEMALYDNRTYSIDPSMTLQEIQRIVDSIPKNLNGHKATIEFANGTYDWYTESPSNPELKIADFGIGTILIKGENGTLTRHWDHGVIIKGTLKSYGTRIDVEDIKFEIDADISSYGINFFSTYIRQVKGCGFEVTTGTANNVTGIISLDGELTLYQNVYGELYNGIDLSRKCRAYANGDLDLATLIDEVPATPGVPARPTNYGYKLSTGAMLSIYDSTDSMIQADVQQMYLDESSLYTNNVAMADNMPIVIGTSGLVANTSGLTTFTTHTIPANYMTPGASVQTICFGNNAGGASVTRAFDIKLNGVSVITPGSGTTAFEPWKLVIEIMRPPTYVSGNILKVSAIYTHGATIDTLANDALAEIDLDSDIVLTIDMTANTSGVCSQYASKSVWTNG